MMNKENDDDIYQELCINNGYESIELNDVSHAGALEVFFNGLPHMIALPHFSHLKELVIIDQSVENIQNMDNLCSLNKLWICECKLSKIENLHFCTHLEYLYLYENNIKKIENLEKLRNLKVLWLNDNSIMEIDNLTTLHNLHDINLAGNHIVRIGNGFCQNKRLQSINLAGNLLNDLEDILQLSTFDLLTSLCIETPEYDANPICRHPNYQNVLLFGMPHIKMLNNTDISSKSLKSSIKSLFNDKIHFYYIQYKHLQSEYDKISKNLFDSFGKHIKKDLNKVRDFCSLYIGYKEKHSSLGSGELSDKIEKTDTEISNYESVISIYFQSMKKALFELDITTEMKRTLLIEEMNSVGNIINKEIDITSSLFESIENFVKSRFCIHQKAFLSVSSIRLLTCYKMTNKMNEKYYSEKLNNMKNNYIPFKEEYWFSSIFEDPIINYKNIINQATNHDCKEARLDWTFSLNAADESRLEQYLMKGVNNYPGIPNYIRCIVYKVLNKDTKDADKSSPCPCPVRFCKVSHKSYTTEDNLICGVPEFILEIEYVTENANYKDIFKNILYPGKKKSICGLNPNSCENEDVSKLFSDLLRHENVTEYMENVLSQNLPHLNLYGFNLSGMTIDINLNQLTSIVLCDCSLYDLSLLHCSNLENLNVSHNYISTLNLMPFFPKLTHFDISFNSLKHPVECALYLKEKTPALVNLKTKYNHWPRYGINHMNSFIHHVKGLRFINGECITKDNRERIKDEFTDDPFCFEEIEKYGSLDYIENKWWFGLVSTNLTSFGERKMKTNKKIEESNYKSVQCLTIESKHLYRIDNLMAFNHLRQINFDHNFIKSLSPFTKLNSLEVLSLNYNYISNLDGLNSLKHLKIFHASNNSIYVITPSQLYGLKSLKLLSLDNNDIATVDGLEKLIKLEELYMANNCINDMGNILQLRFLNRLRVLELSGNPILSGSVNSFSQLIFHLKNLRALNGKRIQTSDFQTAKELLGGRLTNEMVIEKIGHSEFYEVTLFDFSSSSIRLVDIRSANQFHNLTHVNMENNNLTSFSGLLYLENIKILCLNQNKIETLVPKHTPDKFLKSTSTQLLPHLEVLFLANNCLKTLLPLQLYRIASIKMLFLQSNELTSVEGLDGLSNIKVLVLDKNRIRSLSEISLLYNWNLRELYVEDNRIKDLHNIGHLEKLQVLFAGSNKIANLQELGSHLLNLKSLREISMSENPVTKKNLHRLVVVYNLPGVSRIDGISVCLEEKERAAAFYAEQEYNSLMASNPAIFSSLSCAHPSQNEVFNQMHNNDPQSYFTQNSFLTQLQHANNQNQASNSSNSQQICYNQGAQSSSHAYYCGTNQQQKPRFLVKGDMQQPAPQSYRRDSGKNKPQRYDHIIMGQQMMGLQANPSQTCHLAMPMMLNCTSTRGKAGIQGSAMRQISPKFQIPTDSSHMQAHSFPNASVHHQQTGNGPAGHQNVPKVNHLVAPAKWYPPKR